MQSKKRTSQPSNHNINTLSPQNGNHFTLPQLKCYSPYFQFITIRLFHNQSKFQELQLKILKKLIRSKDSPQNIQLKLTNHTE